MADFYMHKTLVQKIQEAFSINSPESTIGAQGPDFFYYVLGKSKNLAIKCGNLIHKSKTKQFLITLFETSIKYQDPKMRDYLIGFLTHHALDTMIHPYIFHYTGLYDEKDSSTFEWAGLHLQFERKVDITFMKHTLGITAHKIHLAKQTLPLKKLSEPIMTMINESVERVFKIKKSASVFNLGYQTMKKVGRWIVFDPFKIKKCLITLIESRKKPKNNYFQDLSHVQNINDFDYLNLNKSPWLHPVTGEVNQQSVLDIFEEAFKKSKRWTEAVIKGFKEKTTQPLESLLENASYDTGLPLSDKQTMTYFSNYLKKITP